MKIELPPKYYLTHFRELRSVLEEHYGPFFESAHLEFLSAFDQLSEDAQCLYPDLPSYGLKNLTQIFNIPLMAHHRALCDAEAAAGLLNLINEKRAEASGKDS